MTLQALLNGGTWKLIGAQALDATVLQSRLSSLPALNSFDLKQSHCALSSAQCNGVLILLASSDSQHQQLHE